MSGLCLRGNLRVLTAVGQVMVNLEGSTQVVCCQPHNEDALLQNLWAEQLPVTWLCRLVELRLCSYLPLELQSVHECAFP